jgi:ribosomal protein S18 acetylase RimI-like enzyme
MSKIPFHALVANGDEKNDTASQPIIVRPPSEADIPSLAAHLSEMQAHYGRPVPDAMAAKAAVLACKPAVHMFDPRVLVALVGETVVGSIVMNVTFPAAELTLSLYIRDLYVAKSARRRGVGRKLVMAANRLRAEQGFSALEWTTDSSNAAARRLYESSGARQIDRAYFNERRGLVEPVGTDRRRRA